MTGEQALERVLYEARDGNDIITHVELALAILRAEAGEGPMPELDDQPACTCPPGLPERGGFRRGCPAHGQAVMT
jgi:hypothetical protein